MPPGNVAGTPVSPFLHPAFYPCVVFRLPRYGALEITFCHRLQMLSDRKTGKCHVTQRVPPLRRQRLPPGKSQLTIFRFCRNGNASTSRTLLYRIVTEFRERLLAGSLFTGCVLGCFSQMLLANPRDSSCGVGSKCSALPAPTL